MAGEGPSTDRLTLWEGRFHLGDGGTVYADATYVGLAIEFPLELFRYPTTAQPADVRIFLEADGVHSYPGYKGHQVLVSGYPAAAGAPRAGRLGRRRWLQGNQVEVELNPQGELHQHIGVRFQIDTSVGPGLYDDLILRRVGLISTTHYGYVGFRSMGNAHLS